MSWDPVPVAAKRDPAVIKAEQQGFLVVERESNQLLLDLDDGRSINQEVYEKLVELYGKPTQDGWTSKSGKGRHVVLSFGGLLRRKAEFTAAEAVALECALGSDPIRTLLNVRRLQLGNENPSVLFRPTHKVAPELLSTIDVLSQEQQRQVFTASVKLEPEPA